MSRDLCKLVKGARAPLQVKSVKDGEDNPLHALHIHKAHHRAGTTADFDEASLNHTPAHRDSDPGPQWRVGLTSLANSAGCAGRGRPRTTLGPRTWREIQGKLGAWLFKSMTIPTYQCDMFVLQSVYRELGLLLYVAE